VHNEEHIVGVDSVLDVIHEEDDTTLEGDVDDEDVVEKGCLRKCEQVSAMPEQQFQSVCPHLPPRLAWLLFLRQNPVTKARTLKKGILASIDLCIRYFRYTKGTRVTASMMSLNLM